MEGQVGELLIRQRQARRDRDEAIRSQKHERILAARWAELDQVRKMYLDEGR
jgi:hypothetical protein